MNSYLELMRPRQWFKAFYLLFGALPAIFLTPLNPQLILWLLGLGVVNLILLQGVVYTINDLADVAEDRKHPAKKTRPIAAGRVRPAEARVFAAALFLLALFVASLAGENSTLIMLADAAFLLLAMAYSMKPLRLRDIPYVDVFTAAINFPLRIAVGWWLLEPYNEASFRAVYSIKSTVIDSSSIQTLLFNAGPRIFDISFQFSSITLSFVSMFVFTYSIAVLLLALKRLAEKMGKQTIRHSLSGYSTSALKWLARLSGFVAVLSFVVFAFSLKPLLVILTPLVAYNIHWYYVHLIHQTKGKTPEDVIMRTPTFLLLEALFFVALVILLFA